MSLEITVLGSSGGYAASGRACSGYLFRHDGKCLVVDIGAGTLSNLLRYVEVDEIDGVAITHAHYDHYVDIHGLLTARQYWVTPLPPLPVLLPSYAVEVIGSPISQQTREKFFSCMEMHEIAAGRREDFAGFPVTAMPGNHAVESYIMRIEAGDLKVCYSGDTDVCDSLFELARGVDLFICEATFTSQYPRKEGGHLSASEAGEIASKVGAKRLLLTHVWPTLDEDVALADAKEKFGGDVRLAKEGMVIEL